MSSDSRPVVLHLSLCNKGAYKQEEEEQKEEVGQEQEEEEEEHVGQEET